MDNLKINFDQEIVNFKVSAEDAGTSLNPLSHIRAMLKTETENLNSRFLANKPIESIVHDRAKWIDQLLSFLWAQQSWPNPDIALLAVGGFGRGELFPYSDIDLLILTETDDNDHLNRLFQTLSLRYGMSAWRQDKAFAPYRSAAVNHESILQLQHP